MVQALNEEERRKLEELRRVKMMATLALVICVCVLVISKSLESSYPALAFVAAFAEAATIGGIADWYAVVALFKHPMGLPIPHTAIIPRNQDRIGDNLGAFIEDNFLAPEPVRRKLGEVDFAGEMVTWLADRDRSEGFAQFLAKLAPQMLSAVDETGLKDFAAQRVATQLQKTDVAPLVMKLLDGLTQDGRHHKLLDEVVGALHKFLNDEDAIEAIRKKVAEELPTVLNIFRADALILRRILKTASALLDDIKADKDHELRTEFEQFFRSYVRRMKRSKRFAKRIEGFKSQILERPELSSIADQMWASLRAFVEEDVASDDSVLVARLTDLFVDIARNLDTEPRLRADINAGMVAGLTSFVETQKHALAVFVADQVKSWDFAQLTLLIEANIGRDLQYIRFNGMLIGGLAGVILHIILLAL
ncbi:MAG: DUF445 family protein [Pseudomonadota bacterium]